MKTMSKFLAAVAMVAAGCATSVHAANDLCKVVPDLEKQRLDGFPEKRDLVTRHALLSVLSAIAYEDEGLGMYKLPMGWVRLPSRTHDSGLFVAVFENAEKNELVIAYRGTEALSPKDWYHNLNPLLKAQSRPAMQHTASIIAEKPGRRVMLTGHSLGGGLALQLSHRLKNVAAVGFNPSPRIGLKKSGYANYRAIFREKHDPLAVIRGNPGARRGWQLQYDALFDFSKGFVGVKAFKQHSIDIMAMNLLALGARWSPDLAELRGAICGELSKRD